jgi:proteasome lid subunit RPN8/RPN11
MSAKSIPVAKFRLGHIVSTPNALSRLTNEDILMGIQRHQAGDWGDVSEEDRQENELSLKEAFGSCRCITPQTARSSGSSPKPTARQRRCCFLKIIDSLASFNPVGSHSFPPSGGSPLVGKRSAVRASSESDQTRSNPVKRVDGRKRVTVNANTESMAGTLDLLDKLKLEIPELLGQAQVVGKWVWLEFNVPPVQEIRSKLKMLGFHWNGKRKCWQHPCGVPRPRSGSDPRSYYEVKPAAEIEMKDASRKSVTAKEFKVVTLRECPLPEAMQICDTPDTAADYWRLNVASHPYFKSECECLVVLLLNTRRRVMGHELVSIGTLDTILVHPREVFRIAVAISAAAVVLMHNHPSGDPTPSEADIKVTHDLIRAGQLMKIEVIDHVIMGNPNRSSLRELGFFFS